MTVTIHVGDCMDVLRTLPAESVHCCVTSPPYYGLRSYGIGTENGEIGLEESPDEYVEKLVQVFREVRRVLHRTGVCWLNLGDSYVGYKGENYNSTGRRGTGERSEVQKAHNRGTPHTQPLAAKQLMMIPARVALALQADGWWLRADIIWAKGNPMPESVTDRPTKAHEYIYLLAKSERYFYDHEAIKEESTWPDHNRFGNKNAQARLVDKLTGNMAPDAPEYADRTGRNKRSVWNINTRPFPEAHFATFPPDLVEPMILAGTSERGACPDCGNQWERVVERSAPQPTKENPNPVLPYAAGSGHSNGTGATTLHMQRESVTVDWQPTCDCGAEPVPAVVLDPFSGAGTALMVADRLGRDAVGIELNASYAQMAARRIYDDAGMFADVRVEEAT